MSTKPQKELETFPNPSSERDYEIRLSCPEFTCLCPRTGQPDFARFTITYVPDRTCVELKSLKLYFLAYRNLGIFQENVVNRVLRDVVAACDPVWCEVSGEFAARGGVYTTVTARHDR